MLGSLGYTDARAGRADDARAIIARLEKSDGAAPDSFSIALVCAGLDECPEALGMLERAVNQPDGLFG